MEVLTDLEATMSQSLARILRRSAFFTDYTGQSGETTDFVIPEDLSSLQDESLAELHAEAVGHFDSIYGDGQSLSDDALGALGTLTDGIEALSTELAARRELAAQRSSAAAELATRVHTESRTEEIEDTEDDTQPPQVAAEGDEQGQEQEGEGGTAPAAPVAVVAATQPPRREIRVNLGAMPRRTPSGLPRNQAAPQGMRDLVYAAGDGTGYATGQGVDWNDIGRIVDRRLAGFNEGQYEAAHRNGIQLSQQHSVATFRKPFPNDMIVQSNDPEHVEAVFARATDESRLQGGSLVAAGGWCAPSEILYDFLELESRDGLFSVPEIGVARGGIQWTTGIDYSTIYAGTGWSYTEGQDIAGTYAVTNDSSTAALHPGSGSAGTKPCYTVPCPTFQEVRLGLAGLCLSAGLLQQRGYPEIIARTTRGALVAHDHKMSVRIINAIVAGSDAVTMTTGTVGTIAPLLDAIEKQVEHYRYIRRMARGTTLEAVFPFWVHGAIRSDMALRQGLPPAEALMITDVQINFWFSSRGIAPQFVYDWQPLTGTAAAMLQWPSTVQFLLYVAGTWVKGASDVITLDTIYDSALLGNNNYTALFTEEGYLVAKRGFDSRIITVPICSNGGTGGPYQLGCDMTTTIADQTNPAAGTVAGSSITATGFTLTVSGSSDAGGLAAAPYRFSTDGGATWTAYQASNVRAITGLVTSTAYNTRAQVKDLSGNVSSTPIVVVTTS